MNNIRILLLSILSFTINMEIHGQSETNLQVYERGFNFKKGIYRSFSDFKLNRPSYQGEVENRNGSLYVYNDSLKRKVQWKKRSWGYSNGTNIYVSTYGGYTRIGVIGELSYFGIIAGGGGATQLAVSTGGVGVGFGSPSGGQTNEYLLDFKTGQFIFFDRKSFERILENRDPLLFEKYKAHKGKKKEKVHLYLNAYNDKHPIYFPE